MNALGIIGGTGFEALQGLDIVASHQPDTPYGLVARAIQEGTLSGGNVLFLQRHASPQAIPPHRINYRANLWALKSLGVRDVIAINAVGGISPAMVPGRLVIPDQLIDYTWGREHTVDDGDSLLHIDFTEPYDQRLRMSLIAEAQRAGIPHESRAVHGVTQGPRLETAAEVQRLARDGCDVVGMTGMPEASVARELGLSYVSVCMVVNRAAGLSTQPISVAKMTEILQREADIVLELVQGLLHTRSC